MEARSTGQQIGVRLVDDRASAQELGVLLERLENEREQTARVVRHVAGRRAMGGDRGIA